MANLVITGRCNAACAYCFAGSGRNRRNGAWGDMTPESFHRALEFVERSGMRQVRFLGGEPTLHPDFAELLEAALVRGLDVLVFSNGRMPETALRRVEAAPAGRVRVLINATAGGSGDSFPDAAVRPALERLGERVLLGMTVSSPGFNGGRILDAFSAFGLNRTLRVGLAHPDPSGRNAFLHPRHYAEAGRRIAGLADRAGREGIGIEFDCGFVPCMFPDDARERFEDGRAVGRRCNPILDVLPDLRVIPCFPLAGMRTRTRIGAADAGELRRRVSEDLKPFRSVRLFRECGRCRLREEGLCEGGCLAAALQRRRFTPFEIAAPARIEDSRTLL